MNESHTFAYFFDQIHNITMLLRFIVGSFYEIMIVLVGYFPK